MKNILMIEKYFSTPRHQPRSTAALASALYHNPGQTSGSFNSSGRSSNCDDGDIHSDISIEEDVMELNSKVGKLKWTRLHNMSTKKNT